MERTHKTGDLRLGDDELEKNMNQITQETTNVPEYEKT